MPLHLKRRVVTATFTVKARSMRLRVKLDPFRLHGFVDDLEIAAYRAANRKLGKARKKIRC